MFTYSFFLKYGREVSRTEVLLEKVPGPTVLGKLTLNCFALLIPVTVNAPLNAEFATPVGLFVLLMLMISTSDPTLKSWGSSVTIVAVFDAQLALAINLGFLNWVGFANVTEEGLNWNATSLVVDPIDVLDSWITYPSRGGFAFVASAGITYRSL